SAIPNCTTRTRTGPASRPVRELPATGWYHLLGLFPPRFRLSPLATGQYQLREKEEEGKEKKEPRDSTLLSFDNPDPFPTSRYSPNTADKMSPPRLRQRGLGVVEDFSSSVRGEEALAMLPRLLSRVRRRQRGFFSPREEKKRDDVTSAMLVTLPPLSNGKDLNLDKASLYCESAAVAGAWQAAVQEGFPKIHIEMDLKVLVNILIQHTQLPAQIDGLFGERRLEGRVIKDAAMPIHQSNPDTPTVLSA
ncbi:hypothetical protein GW17_00037605, partial [Ensete ventricosum]